MEEYNRGASKINSSHVGEILRRVGIGSTEQGKKPSGVGTIKSEIGERPEGFSNGTVITRKKFDKKMNKAIKKSNR